MILPTVGRVVWFYEYRGGTGLNRGPFAAHICHVHSDTMVNLMVIDEIGITRSETSVPLVQDESPPHENYCTWMPYQRGQGAKTEQLASQTGQATPQ